MTTKTMTAPAARETKAFGPKLKTALPGPNAKRECAARYVEEHRPSGTVVTPRLRCWWVRG